MKIQRRHAIAAAILATAGLGATFAVPSAAGAAPTTPRTAVTPTGISNAVFVQTNDTTGNQILAYGRSAGGTLAFAHAYDTKGVGIALGGAVVDKLASQNGLTYDPTGDLLIAVNSGSNTVTSFAVSGDQLSDPHVVAAGETPVSVAVSGKLVYVLDAGGTGGVTGFRVEGERLHAIAGSTRNLGLPAGQTPQFLETPGDVEFTPAGTQLVVTTKANGNDIDVFSVLRHGQLSASPVVNGSATPVPFGTTFDPSGRLIVAEAGDSDLSSYAVDGDGTLTAGSSVTDGEAALCWVVRDGSHFYGANAGSGTLSLWNENGLGQLSLSSSNGGVAATTDAGPIDLATSATGAFLYAQTGGAGTIDEFTVSSTGALTSLGSIDGLSATGMEGIVAS